MFFLVTTRPNWIVPVFRQTGFIVEYKRFPADYMWRPFIDFTELDERLTAAETSVTEILATVSGMEGQLADHETRVTNSEATLVLQAGLIDTAQAAAEAAQLAADAAQATADAALAAAGDAENIFPTFHTIIPSQFRTIAGGFGGATFSTTVWMNVFYLMTGINSTVEIDVLLAAGDYTITMLWTKGSNGGNLTLKFDAVTISTKVGYNATNLPAEEVWTVTGVEAGSHNLNFKVNSNTSPSSAYNIAASLFTIRKD